MCVREGGGDFCFSVCMNSFCYSDISLYVGLAHFFFIFFFGGGGGGGGGGVRIFNFNIFCFSVCMNSFCAFFGGGGHHKTELFWGDGGISMHFSVFS